MALPKFEQFLYPFLLNLKDGDKSKKELREEIVKYFKLTPEDCALMTRAGSRTQIDDRLYWSWNWLNHALFVESPKRGVYHITQRGLDYLAKNGSLTKSDLMAYPEYANYQQPSKDASEPIKEETKTEDVEEITPTDQLEEAYNKINDALASDLIAKVLEQSPQFFERLALDLLLRMGYGNSADNSAYVTSFSHDNGIDGIIPMDKLGFEVIYIQAKRYNTDNVVNKPEIQGFVGALDEKGATKGVFVTTSSFSKGAEETAQKSNKKIILIDGKQLARYMIDYNIGVTIRKEYEVKRLDSDYFEED